MNYISKIFLSCIAICLPLASWATPKACPVCPPLKEIQSILQPSRGQCSWLENYNGDPTDSYMYHLQEYKDMGNYAGHYDIRVMGILGVKNGNCYPMMIDMVKDATPPILHWKGQYGTGTWLIICRYGLNGSDGKTLPFINVEYYES